MTFTRSGGFLVAKPEWGSKHTCTTCSARFYDMCKDPVVCPKCGAIHEKDAAPKIKRGGKGTRGDAPRKVVAAVAAVGEDDLDEPLLDDEDDDALIEDASDLGEDDDDMAEVMDHLEAGDSDE
ncbi:FYDLN acid domain-containing protein [Haematospirillum sp. H4890]|uniref:FYDLN acid domain-containing protein n=1 Tax=Haematospirillum sp. H4890 TaxID=2723110 RepID=UPI001ADE274C|nr:FYDLN acid domain-containing protein [Haematospirillum sp. H4890]